MSFDSVTDLQEQVLRQVRSVVSELDDQQFCIALSGGIDSVVLLHAVASLHRRCGFSLRALHIDHGMQQGSEQWTAHCRQLCESLNVPFSSESVDVADSAALGPEAAARKVRYQAFADSLQNGECLLLAQHQDDQLETYLLQLMRGAGAHGLAAMPASASLGEGWLLRPLLDTRRRDIETYASDAGLVWVEDPSNADTSYDRNFLRHDVLPKLQERWPSAAATVSRSARYAAEAAELGDQLAEIDGQTIGYESGDDRIAIDGLVALPMLRQRNLLRYAIRSCGLTVPPETRLQEVWNSVLPAADDAFPELNWEGGGLRRYREYLYFVPLMPDLPGSAAAFELSKLYEIDHVSGVYALEEHDGQGLSAAKLAEPLSVRFRSGGERIRPAGHQNSRSLKNLFQERGVVPWMRDRVPLLYAGDELVAVGDLLLADGYLAGEGESGLLPVWRHFLTAVS